MSAAPQPASIGHGRERNAPTFTPRQAELISAYRLTGSVKEAALRVGINQKTAYSHLTAAADTAGITTHTRRRYLDLAGFTPQRDVPELEQLRAEIEWCHQHIADLHRQHAQPEGTP